MFDFSIFITIIISILIFNLSIRINLKKEINDLNTEEPSQSLKNKINNRIIQIKIINAITIILLLIITLLYAYPHIINMLHTLDPLMNYPLKILPFRIGFFFNYRFTFSFITGSILCLFCVYAAWGTYSDIISFNNINISIIFKIIFTIIVIIILIWLNYFTSLFLVYHIINYYEILSIVINIFIYTTLFISAIIITKIFA